MAVELHACKMGLSHAYACFFSASFSFIFIYNYIYFFFFAFYILFSKFINILWHQIFNPDVDKSETCMLKRKCMSVRLCYRLRANKRYALVPKYLIRNNNSNSFPLNPSSLHSDQHHISPCNTNAYSIPEFMRIKDIIT